MAVTSRTALEASQTTIATCIEPPFLSKCVAISILDHIRGLTSPISSLSLPPSQILADRLGQYCQVYTLYSSVRPFGLSALLGGIDPDTGKPGLYCIEPSGVYWVRSSSLLPCAGLYIIREDNFVNGENLAAGVSRVCDWQRSPVGQDGDREIAAREHVCPGSGDPGDQDVSLLEHCFPLYSADDG
jgi:hypothetical protein